MNDVNIDEKELLNIDEMIINGTDDINRPYTIRNKYLGKSVRVTIRRLFDIAQLNKATQLVFFYILDRLHKDCNVVKVKRNDFVEVLQLDKGTISKSIKVLIENNFIELIGKDTYKIPIDQTYKGNLNTIIKKDIDNKKKIEEYNKEEEEIRKNTQTYSLNLKKIKK